MSCPGARTATGNRFRRASLFATGQGVDSSAVEVAKSPPEWLQEARAEIDRAGAYVAFDEGGGEYAVVRLEPGWTRIGRSVAADVQLDDATVSRRHALIVLTETGDLRVLDDRSLNGMFVNGELVEWSALDDGDELEIGRYRLYVLRA